MSGNEKIPEQASNPRWYDLVDPATDRVVGHITRTGEVQTDDVEIERRVKAAFDRELLVRNDAIAEDLGVCFADIDTVGPDDTAHHELVFRNLALLTGLVPATPAGSNDPE